MLVRTCNRCAALVPPMPALGAVTLPIEDPATKPKQVTDVFNVSLTMTVVGDGMDLCPVCLVSAFVEYALVAMKGVLTPKIAKQLQDRINAALGFAVGAGDGSVA